MDRWVGGGGRVRALVEAGVTSIFHRPRVAEGAQQLPDAVTRGPSPLERRFSEHRVMTVRDSAERIHRAQKNDLHPTCTLLNFPQRVFAYSRCCPRLLTASRQ